MNEIIDIDDLIEIGNKFSELSIIISEVSDENNKLYKDTIKNLKELDNIVESISFETIGRLKEEVKFSIAHIPKITGMYMSLYLETEGVFKTLNSSIMNFKDSFEEVGKSQQSGSADKTLPDVSKSDERKNIRKRKSKLIKQEVSSLNVMLKGLATKMKVPLPGAAISGGLIWMAMGFKRRQRIAAEAGEIKNILVASTDASVDGVVGKATSKLSSIQEDLQKTYGIVRSDFQDVIKSFANGGIEIERVLDKVGKGLGKAGDNTAIFTYALDKFFELPGGTSAKKTIQIMAEYGKNLEESRDSLMRMMMAGRESGIGMTQFMKNVMSAGDEVKKFGYDINAVADLALTLQERFEELGVPRQFAGRQAALGIKQMASGLVNMSMDWQMLVAERMGYGSGLEGRQKMVSAQARVAREGGHEELLETYKTLASVAMDISGNDETMARQILEQSMGLGFEGAISAIEILKAINTGDVVSAKKLTQDKEKELRNSLLTEREKRSKWELQVNNWMDAVSMIGEGILAGVMNLLAYMIVFGKSITQLLTNYFAGREKENEILIDNISSFMSTLNFNTGMFGKGLDKLINTTAEMGMNVFGDSVRSLESALFFDPMGKGVRSAGLKVATTPSFPISPFYGAGAVSPPMVQTIMAPSAKKEYSKVLKRGTSQGTPKRIRGSGSQGIQQGWVGGGLVINSKGVDNSGNIKLSLDGNCPQCGLRYGDEGISTEQQHYNNVSRMENNRNTRDLEALSRMIASEVGTGRLKKSDPSIIKEAEAIGWTAINRMLEKQKKGKESNLEEVITHGHGFGKQGKKRPYSTIRESTPESQEIAKRILSGEIQDPTMGSTFFYHETGGIGYAGGKHAIPPFAENKVNPVNINKARFYKRKGGGVEDAPDRERRDLRLKKQFKAKQVEESKDANEFIDSNKYSELINKESEPI